MAKLELVTPATAKARRRRTPPTIVASLELSRREMLASMRLALAKEMDAGNVAANALATVSKRIEELDHQIRRIDDAAAEQEHPRGDADAAFDAEAL